jgi:D-inositol-3-phosphate glycosyltransferase
MKVSILNAGQQTDYLYGLVTGLCEIPSLEIEVVDSNSSVGLIDALPHTVLFNLRGDNISAQSVFIKAWRIVQYYIKLLMYTAQTQSQIFHVEWENSIPLIDRTILILYYKLFGKKVIFTAHNIDKDARDDRTTFFRQKSLKMMYHLMDHIIVHTPLMKDQLCSLFRVAPGKVTVIRHGINVRIPRTGLSKKEACAALGIKESARVILFFGQIDVYKGVENLIDAAALLMKMNPDVVLIIAGKPKRQIDYAQKLKSRAARIIPENNLIFADRYIPVNEVELYFTAADCLVLPYKKIFQSGVIFLAYRFGLPMIATNIASFHEDIIENVTGYLCRPGDVQDMAEKLNTFFQSKLFRQPDNSRRRIIELAEQKYSWPGIARQTYDLYCHILSH